jgi:hypothetical protein
MSQHSETKGAYLLQEAGSYPLRGVYATLQVLKEHPVKIHNPQ